MAITHCTVHFDDKEKAKVVDVTISIVNCIKYLQL